MINYGTVTYSPWDEWQSEVKLRRLAVFLYASFAVLAAAYLLLRPYAPVRFPQFTERMIAGPGRYQLPQWSLDGRYLAFFDTTDIPDKLTVYDTETRMSQVAASGVFPVHFAWTQDNRLTYVRFRPDLSGSPNPSVDELYTVALNGSNDTIIAANLTNVGDFAWFNDGVHLAIRRSDPSQGYDYEVIQRIDTSNGVAELLVSAEAVELDHIGSFDISDDETLLIIYGTRGRNNPLVGQVVIYDLQAGVVRDRLFPSQIVPSLDPTFDLWPGIGDSTSDEFVGGNRWFFTRSFATSGECYNYGIFWMDITNPSESFCVPTSSGIISEPTLSPDHTKVSYITVQGPGVSYLMVADLPNEIIERLELD